MLTVFVVVALLAGAVFAGELVRGQCARMLRRPHPSVNSVRLPSSSAETVVTADNTARA
jgi:hypothetical protein